MKAELEKAVLKKFKNKAQAIQFLAKKYAKQFRKNMDSNEYYKYWKLTHAVSSATEFTEEEADQYISEFLTSLNTGVA